MKLSSQEKIKNVKVLFFGRSKKEDLWEHDYILNDILDGREVSTSFLYLDDIRNSNEKFDVFVYSARDPNNYPWGYMPTFDDVLECVKKTNPRIVIQLSDEFWYEDLQIHNTIADHCELFLRKQHHKNYQYRINTVNIPLGYSSGYYVPKVVPKISERKLNWSYVGDMNKSDRKELYNNFTRMPEYKCENGISAERMSKIYSDTIFAPCGRGNASLNCMRLYESSMVGAIPIVVGSKEEIKDTFVFEENPPWLFFNSWQEAENKCQELLNDKIELQKIQDNILYWWNNRIQKVKNSVNNILNAKDKLDFIPSINCISLLESHDRRDKFVSQFEKYNVEDKINFYISERFGEVNEILLFEDGFEDKCCDGNKSIFVSHLKNIKRWYENSDEEYALFCEDDLSIDTVENWNFSWSELVNNLPNDWECVQLTCTGELFNSNFIKLHLRKWYLWGLQSILIKRSYAKKLLDAYYFEDKISMINKKNDRFYYNFGYGVVWPDFHKYPYAENLILNGHGKVYSFPVFSENTDFDATFFINGGKNLYDSKQKPGHDISRNISIEWWEKNGLTKNIKDLTKMIKIIDYFSYFDETGRELLDLRINLLKDYVDQFVIVESNRTHSGALTKPGLRDAIEKYNLPKEKIRIIDLIIPNEDDLIVEEIDYKNCYEDNASDRECLLARVRERLQKDAFMSILNDYDDDCMIIHSDSDEIINPYYINSIKNVLNNNPNGYVKIDLAYLQARADLRTYDNNNNPVPWGCFASNASLFKRTTPLRIRSDKEVPEDFYLLYMVDDNGQQIEHLGWHFSWMGNIQTKKIKAKSFAHYNDSLSFLKNAKYENEIIKDDYFEGSIPPSGNVNHILKKYPLDKLPKIIFENKRMEEFLLPKQIQKENDINFSVNKEPKTSIIVCENFYEDPDAIRNYALSLDFEESDYHRGRRTPQQHVFPGIKEKFEELLGKKIIRWTETYGMCGRFQYCTAEDAIVYHGDSQQWAAVVYLTPDAPYETGTSLLVHKKTGTRHCSDERIWDAWKDTAPTGLYLDGTPWDDIDKIGNVYNRLIIWDGHCPHAASKYFGFTKETSRLFHIFFFDTDDTPSWVN